MDDQKPVFILSMFRLIVLYLTLLGSSLVVFAENSLTKPLDPFDFIAQPSEQVKRGAELYDLVCSDCHGDSGLGIAEGRLSFLPEHQYCEQCHKRNNASYKRDVRLSERHSFNLGEPPALRGDGVLAKFSNGALLYSYLKATMPRYDPGVLSDSDYLEITAFLLALNNYLPEHLELSFDNAHLIGFKQ